MTALFKAVEAYVRTAFDALAARISAVEMAVNNPPLPKPGPKGDPGLDGKDADPAEVARLLMPVIDTKVASAVAALPPPKDGEPGKDGKDVDVALVLSSIEASVAAQIKMIPKPADGKDGLDGKDGKDADMPALLDVARSTALEAVAALPAPRDGKDIDEGAVLARVEALVAEVVAKITPPRDGKDADMAALTAAAEAEARRVAELIPRPKDGKDGEPGRHGKDVDGEAVTRLVGELVEKAVAVIPKPRDGKDGDDGKDVDYVALSGMVADAVAKAVAALPRAQDGRDAAHLAILPGIDPERSYPAGTWARHAKGLWRAVAPTHGMAGWECVMNGVAAVELEQPSPRTFTIRTRQSDGTEVASAFILPVVLDAGIYRPEAKYAKGDGVTWGGSWWIAQIDEPTDKPGVSDQWRLAVKRGRDGKDAEAPRPAPGKVKIGTS